MPISTLPTLLVLASTYPRYGGDPEPAFVHHLSRAMTGSFRVIVIAPHASCASGAETMDGVEVRRFRYAPTVLQTLVDSGGIVANLRRSPWKWLLVPPFLASMAWSTWRTYRREAPQVVHAHWLIPQGLVASVIACLDRAAPPFLVTAHGADVYALRSPIARMLKRLVLGRAARVAVVNNDMLGILEAIRPIGSKASVRPMGVDLEHQFAPDPSVARASDELLFVGRLVEKKGLRHLIEAMPMILVRRPGVVLRVVGFGPALTGLRQQVARLGLESRVVFEGPKVQHELPAYYRRATAFVAPFVRAANGDQEGLGLVAVEAMGCLCPVIASDVPGVRQIADGRDVATLVRPGSPEALADAVVACLEHPPSPERLRRIRGEMVARFDWKHVALGYRDELQRASRGGA